MTAGPYIGEALARLVTRAISATSFAEVFLFPVAGQTIPADVGAATFSAQESGVFGRWPVGRDGSAGGLVTRYCRVRRVIIQQFVQSHAHGFDQAALHVGDMESLKQGANMLLERGGGDTQLFGLPGARQLWILQENL